MFQFDKFTIKFFLKYYIIIYFFLDDDTEFYEIFERYIKIYKVIILYITV